MEIIEIISFDPDSLSDDTKENIFETLVESHVDDVPKKHLRKLLKISLEVLKYKGTQATVLQGQPDYEAQSADERGSKTSVKKKHSDEIAKLKKIISRLESEKISNKAKIKELNEEIFDLQKSLQEANFMGSDKEDSSDPLSELDKQEELMKNISSKNKHIKRLLKDIDVLEQHNVEFSKTVNNLQEKFEQSTAEVNRLKDILSSTEKQNDAFKECITQSNIEISRLETNIKFLEEEKEKVESEFRVFISKLEERALAWKGMLDDKENQLESLRKKYEDLYVQQSNGTVAFGTDTEMQRLVEAMKERDSAIEELENRLKAMTEEMISSTRLMNKISNERETEKSKETEATRSCCMHLEEALTLANNRCKELCSAIENIEQDNIAKSKQAVEAMNALKSYQSGEDGLEKALRKITSLQAKVASRDKHIKALVMEINSLHEIAQENRVLRDRLNIPEDAVVSTKNLIAKERSKDKIIERLKLKLHAAEEAYLELKIEKSQLKKQVKELKSSDREYEAIDEVRNQNSDKDVHSEISLKEDQVYRSNDSTVKKLQSEWEEKYLSVIEENENLRVGMHEILEQIRDYDARSDHVIIDCRALEKVLHALDARSISGWYHPAMRMQNELIAVKEKAHTLKEQMLLRDKLELLKMNLDRTSRGEASEEEDKAHKIEESLQDDLNATGHIEPEPASLHSSRNRLGTGSRHSSISRKNSGSIENGSLREKYRDTLIEIEELRCYKKQYDELTEGLKFSQDKMETFSSELSRKLNESEIDLQVARRKYEFLKEDYQRSLVQLKNIELHNVSVVAELKKELNSTKFRYELLENSKTHSGVSSIDQNGYLKELQKECILLKDKLADLINQLYSDKIENYNPPLNKNLESYIKYAVIKDDFQLDVISAEELEQLKKECIDLTESMQTTNIKYKQLEDLLAITQEQVKSQQKILMDVTDNQINLRHLIADLQAANEDKYIIAKMNRELEIVKMENSKLTTRSENLEESLKKSETRIRQQDAEINKMKKNFKTQDTFKDVKLKFLRKSLFAMQGNYIKFTPLILLCDFVSMYAVFMRKSNENASKDSYMNVLKKFEDEISKRVETANSSESQELIKMVKYETKSRYLEEQLESYQTKLLNLQNELDSLKLANAEYNEHWKTINALFGENKQIVENASRSVQVTPEKRDASVNTENYESIGSSANSSPARTYSICSPKNKGGHEGILSISVKSLESQLKQAMNLASTRSTLLLETENRLAEAQGRIREMEKIIESKNQLLKQRCETNSIQEDEQKNVGLVETTISSLQSLLTEKDTTLLRYQELLKTEREQHSKSCDTYEREINTLKKSNQEMENLCKSKELQCEEYRKKFEEIEKNPLSLNSDNFNECEEELKRLEADENLNEISDAKIEEMFLDEEGLEGSVFTESFRQAENDISTRQIQHLQSQLRELNSRELLREKAIHSKDEEIENLKQKIAMIQDREKVELQPGPEIEQLRILLEEKDKHINDLMETLTSFHDDQQRFIDETSFYSANQVQQLGADLQRLQAANRILNTQIEALRRQVANLTNREKQARDLVHSLKNQLIKRPVVSIKSEINTRTKNEQLLKRISQLEIELQDAKQELQRQTNAVELRRAKNAADLALWEKQKRWQQSAEKLRMKLNDTEASLEKTKMLLTSAKNTINRLEREKHSLELRLRGSKCCRTPSCPNLMLTKYTVAETPDSLTNESDESSAPAREIKGGSVFNTSRVDISDNNQELVNALKARIQSQQRKIVAFELEGKGSNAITTELEKLQEKISALEAQNIRLEAKNLQLQLDNDMMNQSNENERLLRRVKHLEEYTLALKEELSKAQVETKDDKKLTSGSSSNLEQTVLALRRVVEKLRVENKSLKERRNVPTGKAIGAPCEFGQLQALYAEAVDKIASLELELKLKSDFCHSCKGTSNLEGGGDLAHELKIVKEKLVQKSQLLEKAKILLTRAAAKEKNLKEQLTMWKRKCSELKNVPVIDEISE